LLGVASKLSEGALDIAESLLVNSTLTLLSLKSMPITEKGLLAITGALPFNTTLTSLTLSACDLSNDDVLPLLHLLPSLISLKRLDLSNNKLYPDRPDMIQILKSIHHVLL